MRTDKAMKIWAVALWLSFAAFIIAVTLIVLAKPGQDDKLIVWVNFTEREITNFPEDSRYEQAFQAISDPDTSHRVELGLRSDGVVVWRDGGKIGAWTFELPPNDNDPPDTPGK